MTSTTTSSATIVNSTLALSTQIPTLLETLASLQLPTYPSTSTEVFQFPPPPLPRVIPPITIDPIPVQPSILPPSSLLSNLSPTALTPALANLLSATTGPNRRLSCPETVSNNILLDVPSSERRRFSDGYTVDALLREAYIPMTPASFLQAHAQVQAQVAQVQRQQHQPLIYPGNGGEINVAPVRRASLTTRKQRTIYGSRQTEQLEDAFHSQKYMVGAEREQLAHRLGLTESQVRVWFQNRRSKHRKLSRTDGPSTSTSQE
ncbi:unnamed protein product [Caenorhabditis angaria]|uniref:Homeobox domain-containing protein n=1 Tax=Caenorhabditis angaria TaxID=860376 RepID=A0A9P1IKM5_9PELO|nr:unnamed protein product [Caenorhabditis angaria]